MNRSVSIIAQALLAPGETPDVSAVPSLVRRRLSPLQRLYFALAASVETAGPAATAVFASRDGEDTLTRRIVAEFNDDGSVSPHRFSASVYNAAPGLWSVYTKNRAPYTAVAAGEGSIEAGLLEALNGTTPALLVYAEETGGGYGVGLLFGSEGGRPLTVTAGDPTAPFITFEALAAFLAGATGSLPGRWLSLVG